MDEVDKIIFQSLRQVGCTIEAEGFSMASFTPNLLVKCVSTCLKEIHGNTALPLSLPEGMAQRFTVASTLAEICASYGYRSDIGYQTFLYPNAVDVRRLFMFLIEQMPKDNRAALEPVSQEPIGKYEALRNEIKQKMLQQLRSPWMPQYCRAVDDKLKTGCSSHNVQFAPQPNLSIPGVEPCSPEVQVYFQQQAPSVFQQTNIGEFDLISSVLHKNAMDVFDNKEPIDAEKFILNVTSSMGYKSAAGGVDGMSAIPKLTLLEKLTAELNALKCQYEALIAERTTTNDKLSALKSQQISAQAKMDELRQKAKIHERTSLVLVNPKENVPKLEGLIQTTRDRRKTLTQQWKSYREPMEENLKTLQSARQAKNLQNVLDLRAQVTQLENTLREKTTQHSELAVELKTATRNAAPRMEYTRRIMEFVGNIRKQRNDIYKVLDDTRDLQKQLNSVSAQLQRQFNYTDDLLFQSAKHDPHAKKAYKLLAALHTTCNDLIELVSQTGNLTKETRDLVEQIDREKMKNISVSLKQISVDTGNFENVVKTIQTEIRKVENEITAG